MSDFHFSIRTPEAAVLDRRIAALVAPGTHGSFGVLARHAPMVAAVGTGILKLTADGADLYFVVGDGFLDVSTDGATLLTGLAIPASSPADAEEKLANLRHPSQPR
jgi:F-type H+-transporting ATPase subunit epsilon